MNLDRQRLSVPTTILDFNSANELEITAAGAAKVDGSAITQPISAASLPLPSGAATEATLATLFTTTSFQSRINTLGQKTMANSTPVVLASDQTSFPVTQGTSPWIIDGSGTIQPISGTVTGNQGSPNTAANRWPVQITDGTDLALVSAAGALLIDGSAVTQPISASSLPLPTGAATEAKQTQPGVDIGDVTINNGTGAAAVNIQDGGNSITVDGPLTDTQLRASAVPISLSTVPTHPVTQSGEWSIIPDRPSQKTGRVHKTGQTTAATSTTTIYTVTASKTLYVTSIIISGFNSSTSNNGILNIRDDTTVKIPVSIPTAGLGALSSLIPITIISIPLQEPLQFTTNFNVEENAGTLTFSVSFVGYEE